MLHQCDGSIFIFNQMEGVPRYSSRPYATIYDASLRIAFVRMAFFL